MKHYVQNAIDERVAHYARAVDSVFFEKDQKIEDLEWQISQAKMRIEELENKSSERRNENLY